MNKEVLKELQLTELEILKEIKRICEKHNLTYFLMYGSLLGAVRHQGFIPWDDDIDIAMPRKDYQKFQEIALRELKDKFELDCIKTNKNYYLPFVKVRNKLTSFQEKKSINYQGSKGIWVDIFPFDNVKEFNKLVKLKTRFIMFFASVLTYKSLKLEYFSLKVKIMSKLVTNKLLINLIDLLAKGKEGNNYIFYDDNTYNKKIIFSKNDIFPLIDLEFEGHKFKAPHNYARILTILYNDYLKLPKVSERITHSPLKIVFEDQTTYSLTDNKKDKH